MNRTPRSPRRKRRLRSLASRALLLLALSHLTGCDTVGVKDAYTALDGEGNRKREVFYTDTETIYCVIEMASGVADVTVVAELRAKQLYDDFGGKPRVLDAIVGAEEQAPGANADIKVSFALERPEGLDYYPAGAFACDMFIDGKREATLDFEVRFPECPFAPIENGTSCAGTVLRGSMCPGPLGGRCVCEEEAGLWACDT